MDVDVVGVADPIADTEVLAVAVDSLKSIGFEGFVIRLNDRRLLEALVGAAGMPLEKRLDIFRAVDKRDKIGDEGVQEELEKLGVPVDASMRLLELTSRKGDPGDIIEETRKILGAFPQGLAACDALSSIVDYSVDFGIDPYLIVDLGLARGFDYYTGPVFEVYAEDYMEYGSIAGGGRYDELVQLFGGEPTPMTGVSMGIERLVLILGKMGVFDALNLAPDVYVVYTSVEVRSKAIEVTQTLRGAGVSTEIDLLGRGMRRQLDIANRRGVGKVVIVGERELRDGCVVIRDMATADQRKVELGSLVKEI
jgi:histidyl-tRNA synthetase